MPISYARQVWKFRHNGWINFMRQLYRRMPVEYRHTHSINHFLNEEDMFNRCEVVRVGQVYHSDSFEFRFTEETRVFLRRYGFDKRYVTISCPYQNLIRVDRM